MNKTFHMAVKAFLAGALTFACAVASAQWAVFDPTNLVQNLATARATVKSEITAAAQLKHDIESAIQLAKSTKSLSGLKDLVGIQNELRMYSELRSVDSKLEGILERAHQLGLNIQAQVGASDGSWENFLQSRNSVVASQREAALAQFQMMNSSMEATTQRRKQIVDQLANVNGQTEAMQSLGAALDVIIGQNQQMIATMAQANLSRQADVDIQQANHGVSSQALDSYQQKLRAAARKY